MAEAQPTVRRDRLLEIERTIQKFWDKQKTYESVADDKKKEKFMATFPYPYMNGLLHLGHAFTITKAEFACRYQRILGKNVLFPFGFHCTGQPIAGAAIKLQRELINFGNPPEFPPEEKKADGKDAKSQAEDVAKQIASIGKSKKTKVAAKKGGKYQWQILEDMGLSDEEIPSFSDPTQWIHYFPKKGLEHLKKFGLCVDWRRSFITTSVNPYYDSFIRWQFRVLKEKGKIFFGKRMTVFSPSDNQPCADHDRLIGEGVGITDYTLIKIALLPPYPKKVAAIVTNPKFKVYLPAATLRPETMYGQTNVFVLPDGDYGLFQVNDTDIFIQSERSAINMTYQELTPKIGQPIHLGTIKGSDVLGHAVKAPHCTYDKVYVLPLLTIKMDKGTGVVTSVPSDAPDDWAALTDLKKKPELRAKYGITDEMVLPYDVIPIIQTGDLGTTPAKDLCIEAKVNSQNDREKLEEIKGKCYLESFGKGIMLVGECKGEKVSIARVKIRDSMVKAGQAMLYSEPESKVISRSGSECVAALTDQWFLTYGEEKWKAAVDDFIKTTLNTYTPQAREKFEFTMGWLKIWACSRSSGLGTLLPWDEQFVIESLSDSTIYMAYYTVAHLLQGGNLEGSKTGPSGIPPQLLTDDVWNYIFLSKKHAKYPAGCGISKEVLDRLKKEFEYWYPMDLRVSGKDLIQNHLTMALYNHAAVWEGQPDKWPRAYFTNGHLMRNAEKMSKSLGNFLTVLDAINKYSSDAVRFALAEAGDGLDEANFQDDTANAAILFLTKEESWLQETYKNLDKLRTGDYNFFDEVFDNEINVAIHSTKEGYEQMKFRDAMTNGFRRLTKARDDYRFEIKDLHRDLIVRWCETLLIILSPICPHWCQYQWQAIGKEGLVDGAGWPEAEEENKTISRTYTYLRVLREDIRNQHAKKLSLLEKKLGRAATPKDLNAAEVHVAAGAPGWMKETMQYLLKEFEENKALPSTRDAAGKLNQLFVSKGIDPKKNKVIEKAMQIVSTIGAEVQERGKEALKIDLPFDEEKIVLKHKEWLTQDVELDHLEVVRHEPDQPQKVQAGQREIDPLPGRAILVFLQK